VSDAAPSELQRLIAAEFDRQRWEYDLGVGESIVAEIERTGEVIPDQLVQRLPAAFFRRNCTSRDLVASAIGRAVGGRTPKRPEEPAQRTLIFDNSRHYDVKLGTGAQITNSQLNVGEGTQINVSVQGSKEDVLAAVEALLRAGLAGDWNIDAARELATVIDSRDDVGYEEVQAVTAEVVQDDQPKQGRVKELLLKITTSGLGGALATGISAGAGELIHQLPS
jgi:hypothetical protein